MGELGINLPGLITQLISFSILLFLISKFLYKPVVKLLDERAEKIKIAITANARNLSTCCYVMVDIKVLRSLFRTIRTYQFQKNLHFFRTIRTHGPFLIYCFTTT